MAHDGDETAYRDTINQFVDQCDRDELYLNVSKTKEMIVDFRKDADPHDPIVIKGSEVDLVPQYDYLGTRVRCNLSWGAHISKQASKAMKRMYHLRKLRQFQMSTSILQQFYESVIENVLYFSVVVWGGSATNEDKKKISRVRRCAGRITKGNPAPLYDIYKSRALSLVKKVMSDPSHPLSTAFTKLPSGRRLRQPRARTSRYRNSFVPNVTALLNA